MPARLMPRGQMSVDRRATPLCTLRAPLRGQQNAKQCAAATCHLTAADTCRSRRLTRPGARVSWPPGRGESESPMLLQGPCCSRRRSCASAVFGRSLDHHVLHRHLLAAVLVAIARLAREERLARLRRGAAAAALHVEAEHGEDGAEREEDHVGVEPPGHALELEAHAQQVEDARRQEDDRAEQDRGESVLAVAGHGARRGGAMKCAGDSWGGWTRPTRLGQKVA
mmetsp:Transcript_65208/g.167833  ORF Transcript_65208/g.167833 Transcript_65208/m.167833 type:complete len:225 (+) Transcript_65208:98-772(+)